MSTNRGPAAAADNRAALIRAAGEIFAEQGLDAPLNAVAKRAGVGQGSLYRHFPTRVALVFAAFESNLTEIEQRVADGGDLADVLGMIYDQAISSVPLIDLITAHAEDPEGEVLHLKLRGLIESTIDEGRASGTVPAGFSVDDVLVAIMMFAGALRATPVAQREELAKRAWQLMGIRL